MHRVSANHRVLGRSIAELDARGHPLINVPPPVNAVPVVGQLAAPLVGNGASGGAQPSSSPNPQPSPSGNGNGGGHGNGNGNGGGSGNGGGHSNGGGSTPAPPPSSTSDGGPAATPTSPVPSPVSPNPVPGQPSSSSHANNVSNGSSMASHSTTSGGGGFLGNAGQTAPVNAAPAPSMTSAALGASAPSALPSYFPSNSLSNTAGTVAPSSTTPAAAAVSSGKQFSGGAIAGIVVVVLFVLFPLILLVVRRHSIARRLELRRRWWFGRSALGNDSSLSNGNPRNSMGSNGEVIASRQSARSSFATNFDHGLMFRADPRLPLGLVPDLPPSVAVRERNSILISTGGSVAPRESINSMLSNGSDPFSQYLNVSTGQDNLDPSTPMSVRPFSPSESFAFPKPPPSSTINSFFVSGAPGSTSSQSSAATLVHVTTPSRAFMTDFPPAMSTSLHHQTSTPSLALSPFVAAPNPSLDPFSDPVKPEFSDVEVIRRPFTPTLNDELAVQPGDRVRVFKVFDDGWAFVERLSSPASERHERGLIPVDCFRQVDQALQSFLAEKRLSYSDSNVAVVG